MASQQPQRPGETAASGVAPCEQHVEALVPQNLSILGLLRQSVNERVLAVQFLISILLCLSARAQRLVHRLIHKLVAPPARVAEGPVVQQPVELAQATTMGEVVLRQVEGLCERRLLARDLAPVQV